MVKKILFIDNTAHHAYGQVHNMHALRESGHLISILIPDDGVYFHKLQILGYNCINSIDSWKGQNPFQELLLLLRLKKIITTLNPDLICSFTIKPNLYTAIAIKNSSIKQIANITGLGYGFMRGTVKVKLFSMLYRFALKNIDQIFFQNGDDYSFLLHSNIIRTWQNADVLPGSGVDLTQYHFIEMKNNSIIKFLFSGRVIGDKGVNELVKAFYNVCQKYSHIKLILIGNFFPANPSAISQQQVKEWVDSGIITYLGMVDNVVEVIQSCDCVVLPSYREGMPRSLLEASSMGRPIITVDSIGCKDVVEDGVTGYLAKVKDVDSLAEAMIQFIELPFADKVQMGLNGRRKMEREFDQQVVVNKYLEVAQRLLHDRDTAKDD